MKLVNFLLASVWADRPSGKPAPEERGVERGQYPAYQTPQLVNFDRNRTFY